MGICWILIGRIACIFAFKLPMGIRNINFSWNSFAWAVSCVCVALYYRMWYIYENCVVDITLIEIWLYQTATNISVYKHKDKPKDIRKYTSITQTPMPTNITVVCARAHIQLRKQFNPQLHSYIMVYSQRHHNNGFVLRYAFLLFRTD